MKECTIEAEQRGKVRVEFVNALNKEVEQIREGKFSGATDEPLVNTPIMKLMWKHNVDGAHEINRRLKYPELMDIVDEVEKEKDHLSPKGITLLVKSRVQNVESKMPYKSQFVFECLGYEV
jgi:hypothetical protein